jgi:DNA-binding response OmpR family regulator
LRLLEILLEQPGEPVTRERLREALWASDTFVDFERSLNAAVQSSGRRCTIQPIGRFTWKPLRRKVIDSLRL